MIRREIVERLKIQLESMGYKAAVCGACGALIASRLPSPEEPVSKFLESKNLKIEDLFCLCA